MLELREAANRLNRAGPFCNAEATPMGLVLLFQEVKVTIPPTGYLPVRVERRASEGTAAIYVLEDGTRLCRDGYDDLGPEKRLHHIEHVPLTAEPSCECHGALVDKSDEIR